MMPVSPGVVAAELALAALAVLAALGAARHAARHLPAPGPARTGVLTAALGCGLLALGARLCLARGHVSWAPFLDQWGAELQGVVAPLGHLNLGAGELFAGNNEHRVFLTRSLALLVTLVNGAWDNRPMAVANYLLESAAIAWVALLAWSYLGWARGSVVAAAALLPMFLVCGWESMMWSNQTQFVFMAFGSVFALSLYDSPSLRTLAGWGALAAGLLTLGSMASGFLAPVCMAATALALAYVGRTGWRPVAGYCAVCLALAAVGWMSRAPCPVLDNLYAKGPADWLKAFAAYAAWPLPANVLGLAALWLPWAVLLARALRRRPLHPFAPFALGLGLWVLLQACAVAYARAWLSGLVSSRYTEFLGWGVVANAAAIAIAIAGPGEGRAARRAGWALVALWLGCVGGFEAWRSAAVYRPYFESYTAYTREHEQRMGTFMRTGDAGVITREEFPHIPHYSAKLIVAMLSDAQVQPLLPGPLRRDLVRDREPELVASTRDGPLSLLAVRALRGGYGFAAAGLALIAFGAFRSIRGAPGARPPPP